MIEPQAIDGLEKVRHDGFGIDDAAVRDDSEFVDAESELGRQGKKTTLRLLLYARDCSWSW